MSYKPTLKFGFDAPTKLIFGPGAIKDLPMEMEELSGKRALVVTDKGISRGTDFLDWIRDILGSGCAAVYDGVRPDSSLGIVEEGFEIAKEAQADTVISIGGGSSIDTAKAIALLLKVGGKVDDHLGTPSIPEPITPHIVIPTTAGTGSEVTFVSVLKDTQKKRKVLINHMMLIPRVAILDPELTLDLPKELTAYTGMDALTHSIEALISRRRSPVSDGLALHGISLVLKYLPRCVNDGRDIIARGQQLIASTLGGMSFNHALVGIVHAMAHPVGAMCGVQHGLANSILLPYGLKFNITKSPEQFLDRYLPLARCLGVEMGGNDPRDEALRSTERIFEFAKKLGLPLKLREVGVPREILNELASEALGDPSILTNPCRVGGPEEIEAILEEAW